MTRKDLQGLAITRLAEAKALLSANLPNGAYYLAGYTVECAFKACIAKRTCRYDFPDKKTVDASHTHSLRELERLAYLDSARAQREAQDDLFRENWRLVREWSEQSRYRQHTFEVAEAFVSAVSDKRYGVYPWIKRHW